MHWWVHVHLLRSFTSTCYSTHVPKHTAIWTCTSSKTVNGLFTTELYGLTPYCPNGTSSLLHVGLHVHVHVHTNSVQCACIYWLLYTQVLFCLWTSCCKVRNVRPFNFEFCIWAVLVESAVCNSFPRYSCDKKLTCTCVTCKGWYK
jgi:hypothetical protein